MNQGKGALGEKSWGDRGMRYRKRRRLKGKRTKWVWFSIGLQILRWEMRKYGSNGLGFRNKVISWEWGWKSGCGKSTGWKPAHQRNLIEVMKRHGTWAPAMLKRGQFSEHEMLLLCLCSSMSGILLSWQTPFHPPRPKMRNYFAVNPH